MQRTTPELRTVARHRTFKRAHIAFEDHGAVIDCVVWDLSELGACLKVENPSGIPDSFDLVIDDLVIAHAPVRNCRVAWRSATQIGVEFAQATAPALPRSGFVR
jgi:PilZ domain